MDVLRGEISGTNLGWTILDDILDSVRFKKKPGKPIMQTRLTFLLLIAGLFTSAFGQGSPSDISSASAFRYRIEFATRIGGTEQDDLHLKKDHINQLPLINMYAQLILHKEEYR
jgi:hypothetical protein